MSFVYNSMTLFKDKCRNLRVFIVSWNFETFMANQMMTFMYLMKIKFISAVEFRSKRINV